MAGISGKAGTFSTTEGGDERMHQWTFNGAVNVLDDTSSGDGGEQTVVAGVTNCTGSFVAHYDSTNNNVTNLIPGSTITSVVMNADGGTKLITVASALVESMEIALDINGQVELTVNWVGNGTTLSTALTAM